MKDIVIIKIIREILATPFVVIGAFSIVLAELISGQKITED